MAESEEEKKKKSRWEGVVRKMTPPGAPLPDEDHLDYSIAVEYHGPLPCHPLPKINPLSFDLNHHDNDDNNNDDNDDNNDDEDDDGRLSHCSSAAPIVGGERKRVKKRGPCSRCGKGNRLTERELCIVCDAKYCGNCLIKAMGSMPEGRKCVTCLGHPIDESRRECLGKLSKILRKACSSLEVKHILQAEKECFANQLRPEQLVVNGRPLVASEMVQLFRCSRPPRNLKPGKYWYDKDSGLWGKEGEKPDRFISSKLNVGGKLMANASNGNTQVFFNGREITKAELRVLKLAKVQCPQATHFWVYDDGSYEEEGQNSIKGYIWEKASTRFLSSLLSLPVPPGKFDGAKDDFIASSDRLVPEYLERGRIRKLVLLGLGGSGTSTIFKQAKFLSGDKFTAEEVENIKFMIQSNLYKYIGVLLEGREGFEEEALMIDNDDEDAVAVDGELLPGEANQCIYSMNPRLKKHADWLLNILATGDLDAFFPAATREYAPLVEELWRDSSIQETYKRRDELNFLPETAKYFLDRAVEISSNDYEPSEKDIIYAQGFTQSNGLASVEFSFEDRNPLSVVYDENVELLPSLTKYQLVCINSNGLKNGSKWLDMFEDVRAVVYCVAISDYDVMWTAHFTDCVCNKMLASRDLFESLVQHPSFRDIPFVLLMNKYDAFEEKISRVPLTVCEWFEDFGSVKLHSNSHSLASQAYYYVAVKFKELYASLTGRKLYVCQTRALELRSVDEALKYVWEVLKWDEERDEILYGLMADDSSDSTEMNSFVMQD